MSSRPAVAWVILGTLSLIWGSSFILIKKGLVVLSPGEIGALRIVSASIVLFPFAIRQFRSIKRSQVLPLMSVGFTGSLIPSFLFAIAQTQLQSSITGVINALTPLFTIIIGVIFFSMRPRWITYLGLAIGFIGTAILILNSSHGQISINAYAFFVVGATICYGTNVNIIRRHLHGVKSLTITSLSLAFVGPIGIVYLAFFTPFLQSITVANTAAYEGISYIVLLGVLGTAGALVLFNKLVQITDPVFASSVTYIIPVIAVIWGLLDGEQLGIIDVAGMVTILSGVYLANKKP